MTKLLLALSFLCISCASHPQKQGDKNEGQYEIDKTKGAYEQIDSEDPAPTVVKFEKDDYNDPLEYVINRPFFFVNHYLYSYVLSPLASGYNYVVPDPVDYSIGNFFSNIREPIYSFNFLLQGELSMSAKSLLRLVVNSTVGILGLFDVADSWFDLTDDRTDLNQTLASYGVDYGVYIVIPVLGPSHLRGGLSIGSQYYYHPLNWIDDQFVKSSLFFVEGFQEETDRLEKYPNIMKGEPDRYTLLRNFYLQNEMRDAKILRDKRFEPSNKKRAEN